MVFELQQNNLTRSGFMNITQFSFKDKGTVNRDTISKSSRASGDICLQ